MVSKTNRLPMTTQPPPNMSKSPLETTSLRPKVVYEMYIVTLVTCKPPLNKLFSLYSAEINVEIPVIPRRHKTDARNCC